MKYKLIYNDHCRCYEILQWDTEDKYLQGFVIKRLSEEEFNTLIDLLIGK